MFIEANVLVPSKFTNIFHVSKRLLHVPTKRKYANRFYGILEDASKLQVGRVAHVDGSVTEAFSFCQLEVGGVTGGSSELRRSRREGKRRGGGRGGVYRKYSGMFFQLKFIAAAKPRLYSINFVWDRLVKSITGADAEENPKESSTLPSLPSNDGNEITRVIQLDESEQIKPD